MRERRHSDTVRWILGSHWSAVSNTELSLVTELIFTSLQRHLPVPRGVQGHPGRGVYRRAPPERGRVRSGNDGQHWVDPSPPHLVETRP